MTPEIKRKYLKIWGLVSLALIVLFPDVVFDTTLSILGFLFDHLAELSHLLFEAIESTLDHLIEGLFETDLHSTQTIVFYVLLSGILYILYRIGKVLLRVYRRYKAEWDEFRAAHHTTLQEYWHGSTTIEKIKWAAILAAAVYLYVTFFI